MPTRQDLEPSPALSIVERGPKRFEGRKLGILVTDGADVQVVKALLNNLTKQKAVFEVIAPKVGGVTMSDGSWLEAHQMVDGGPSVLYDAVALIVATDGVADLLKEATARDFVADAFTHCKFIGYVADAIPLLEKAGIAGDLDEGTIELKDKKTVETFFEKVGKLRIWAREPSVKLN